MAFYSHHRPKWFNKGIPHPSWFSSCDVHPYLVPFQCSFLTSCQPDLFTRLVHPTCGALKVRSCSRLGGSSTHWRCSTRGLSLGGALKRGIVPDWTHGSTSHGALKKQGVVLHWTHGLWQVFDLWIVPSWSLNNGEAFSPSPPLFLLGCRPIQLLSVLLSPPVNIVGVSCM